MKKFSRIRADIDLDAVLYNFESMKANIRPGCKITAVIKADGYGHGAVSLAALYERLGADYFAVSNLDEAKELRDYNISLPILILGYTPVENAVDLAELGITQAVYSLDYAKALSEQCEINKIEVKVHIKEA